MLGSRYANVTAGHSNRVFAIKTILDLSKDTFDLESFSYVDDAGDLHEQVPLMHDDME